MSFYTTLYVHFMTNFSFYTLKSFLILYLTQQMGLETPQALLLFGNIMGLSYFMCLWNSSLSDKYFSTVLSISLGICLLIGGFVSIPLLVSKHKIFGFIFICLASGFYKPSLLAEISRPGMGRPPKATIYFYGVSNLSTVISGIMAGSVIHYFGMNYVFFLLAGLLLPPLYVVGSHLHKSIWNTKKFKGLAFTILSGGGVFISLSNAFFLKTALPFLLLGTMAYLLREKTLRQKSILLTLCLLTIFIMFLEIFSGATTLFIEHHVHRTLGVFVIPTSFFHSINPFIIIGLAGLSVLLNSKKSSSDFLPSFSKGFLFLTGGVGFLVVCTVSPPSFQLIFLILTIFFQTMGEFLILPQSLQYLGKTAEDKNRQRAMSLWLRCISGAHILSSYVSGFLLNSALPPSKEAFFTFYIFLGGVALIISMGLLFIFHLKRREEAIVMS